MIVHLQHHSGPNRAGGLARWAGWIALGVSVVLIGVALAVAATAAAVIALIVAIAMAALRLGVRRPKPTETEAEAGVLEARRTAEGWIVEAEPRPR